MIDLCSKISCLWFENTWSVSHMVFSSFDLKISLSHELLSMYYIGIWMLEKFGKSHLGGIAVIGELVWIFSLARNSFDCCLGRKWLHIYTCAFYEQALAKMFIFQIFAANFQKLLELNTTTIRLEPRKKVVNPLQIQNALQNRSHAPTLERKTYVRTFVENKIRYPNKHGFRYRFYILVKIFKSLIYKVRLSEENF